MKICSVPSLFSCVAAIPFHVSLLCFCLQKNCASVFTGVVCTQSSSLRKSALTAVPKAPSSFNLWKREMFSTGCSNSCPSLSRRLLLHCSHWICTWNKKLYQVKLHWIKVSPLLAVLTVKTSFRFVWFFKESIALFPIEIKIHYLINIINTI